ncbi:cellulose biosynthesis protein BcsE [Chromobacterium phragmitis]|uniref:Cellulose biosynthesis protein BcsE n=1 Tax=Chromobacterium phragmitis TaxID=2202141 RepID=A0A344UDS0_9NEIS|nr:cellulose biosynthesis protein BcsE [Chromobacterium phragmitis]AXE32028.1 cellulose biosynthesis protein BcsE [Chromobacterium phragmitis]AXE33418.1 cellulose biosynthesis protein BcsE [Chromobacterium phragmitis]
MDTSPSLGIHDLPVSATSLAFGGLYLVACDSDALTQALLFVNLPAANAAPLICSCPHSPGSKQNTVWLDRRILSGSLTLLSPKGATPPPLSECLEELSHARDHLRRDPAQKLLVLGNAEDYLNFKHPDASRRELRAAMRWTEARGHCALLLASRQRLDMAAQAMLTMAARQCAGLALAQEIGADTYSWQAEHWMGAGPAEESHASVLTRDAAGALRLLKEESDALASRPAGDILQVYATRASLAGSEPPSPLWQLFEDIPALLDATRDAVAATVLLDTAGRQREILGEAVAKLRQQCGCRLKILVREAGNRRLRQNEEQLMLQLGANLVLPAELHFATAVNLINSLQPAVYQRHSHLEPQKLQDASQPLPDRGYLPPARFADAVRKTVQRSGSIHISNTLVILSPASGIAPREMLAQGRFQRAGDLCTADAAQAYLFLFACGEADVPAALRNLFRLPVSELAENEVRCPDNDAIAQALARLESQPDLPDLSQALSNDAPPDTGRIAPRITLRRGALRRRDNDGEAIDA